VGQEERGTGVMWEVGEWDTRGVEEKSGTVGGVEKESGTGSTCEMRRVGEEERRRRVERSGTGTARGGKWDSRGEN
jgi:hypothetical protein